MQKVYTSILYLSLKNLLRKPFRTVAIAAPIALLVSFLIFAMSVNSRVKGGIERTINRLGGDVMIVPAGALTAAEQFLIESKRPTFHMEREILDKIKSLPYIDKITHHIYLTTLYGICCGVSEAQIIAFDPEADFVVASWLKESIGKGLEEGEVFVGSTAYAEWQLLKIGKDALILGRIFKIAGVLEPTGTSFDNTVFISERDVIKAIKEGLASKKIGVDPNRISVIFVKLKEGYDPERIARLIEERFLEVDAVSRGEVGRGLKSTLSDIIKVFSLTSFLTAASTLLIIGAFFSVIVNERMREAGIIRALGAKRVDLSGIFTLEAVILGIIGGVSGLALGNTLNLLLANKLLIVGSSMRMGLATTFKINSLSFLLGPVICVMGALLPIIRISRMEPYEAIRRGE